MRHSTSREPRIELKLTDVKVEVGGRIFVQLGDESLDGQDLRLRPSGGGQPVAVQVEPQVRAAVVPVHDALARQTSSDAAQNSSRNGQR